MRRGERGDVAGKGVAIVDIITELHFILIQIDAEFCETWIRLEVRYSECQGHRRRKARRKSL